MSSNGPSSWAVVAGVAGVVVLLAAGLLALRPGDPEVQYQPTVTFGSPEEYGSQGSSKALVVAKHESGGSSLFGISFGTISYRISVQFFTEPGCFPLVDFGEQWPSGFAECSTDIDVAGSITGLGRAQTGDTIVVVDLDVTTDCFRGVSEGDWWPPATDACLPGP